MPESESQTPEGHVAGREDTLGSASRTGAAGSSTRAASTMTGSMKARRYSRAAVPGTLTGRLPAQGRPVRAVSSRTTPDMILRTTRRPGTEFEDGRAMKFVRRRRPSDVESDSSPRYTWPACVSSHDTVRPACQMWSASAPGAWRTVDVSAASNASHRPGRPEHHAVRTDTLDVCIEVDTTFEPSGEAKVQTIPGAACVPFRGTAAEIRPASVRASRTLPRAGYLPRASCRPISCCGPAMWIGRTGRVRMPSLRALCRIQ